MPAERLSVRKVRKVREVLRLRHTLRLGYRKISNATGIGKTQVAEYVRRAEAADLGWPLPDGLDDVALEQRLFTVTAEGSTPPGHRLAGDREGACAAPDWIGAHVNALATIGGVPNALVPDNLKAGITKPSRFEPGINRTYQDLADHYDCVVLPTRRHCAHRNSTSGAFQPFSGWERSNAGMRAHLTCAFERLASQHTRRATMSIFSDAWNKAKDAADKVGDVLSDAADAVGGAAEDTGEAIGGAVEDAGEAIGGAAKDVGELPDKFFDWAGEEFQKMVMDEILSGLGISEKSSDPDDFGQDEQFHETSAQHGSHQRGLLTEGDSILPYSEYVANTKEPPIVDGFNASDQIYASPTSTSPDTYNPLAATVTQANSAPAYYEYVDTNLMTSQGDIFLH